MRMTKILFSLLCLYCAHNALDLDPKAQTTPEGRGENNGRQTATPSALQILVDNAARETVRKFAAKNFQEKNLAITVIDLAEAQFGRASFRGDVPIYPASVVKLFYLAAAHRWLEDKKISPSAELDRAMHDMIVDSSNEATHYVLDCLTETTSGPELPAAEMNAWRERRNAVNRYFAALGYEKINVNQKPWCEGPYGRDRIFVGEKYTNRNMLTTDATARLLADIVTNRSITAARSRAMMELLKRDPEGKRDDPDDQSHGFTGLALGRNEPGARLWSKAGWTSTTRHDAAYIETPDGLRFIIVTFTTEFSNERDIIPTVARRVIDGLRRARTAK
ncbi:MAG TPA: serine hydrolase [Pyrinomonadaceae bacterium]|jgi:beta-lactamase class A|nr:serine hydrolase [Pyrinomonadaceae bacterium]